MMMEGLWVVIPAHNEEDNVSKVIKKTKKYSKNIVVIDDGSEDSTYKISKKGKIVVLRHIVNLGKGAALKTGCEYALKHGAKMMISMDSDGQHNPKDIPRFARNLKYKDIVFGYRKMYGKIPLILRFGNWFINKTTEILYGIRLRDTQCGFRAFTSQAYKKIRWNSLGYEVESEMIANAGKHKLKYSELPIETVYLDKYKGTGIIEGIKIVLNMFWWKIASTYWRITKK